MSKKESRFQEPDVDFVGYPVINAPGLHRYLERTGNTDFEQSWREAEEEGLSDAEILCSVFSKLCYKSLTVGQNANITRVRDIKDNLVSCFDTGHGSIFEHVMFNFIVSPCSRVFTHELVRHRIGVAFSQTSGRYVRLDHIPIIWDPILDGDIPHGGLGGGTIRDLWDHHLQKTEDLIYLTECFKGLRKPAPGHEDKAPEYWIHSRLGQDPEVAAQWKWVPDNSGDFAHKKKLTSAIRRIAPNGQVNEIAYSVNLRSLRHTILMRTARVAEREIRIVFNKIYDSLKDKWPLMFHGAKEEIVDGIPEITGMKCQPYEKPAEMVLEEMSDEELVLYLKTRPDVIQRVNLAT